MNKFEEVANVLLADPRFNPTKMDSWCLRSASATGHTSIVRLLLTEQLTASSVRENDRADPTTRDNQVLREYTKYASSCLWPSG